jgi:uncharacterized membrane protein YhaH (DUF805 family)
MNWRKLLLSPHGRIGRKTYWLFSGLVVIAALVLAIVDEILFPASEDGVLSSVFALGMTWPNICVQGKRLHDLGRSAWFQLAPYGGILLALPLMAVHTFVWIGGMALAILAFYVWLGFFKGEPGPNRYGEPNSGDRDTTPVAEVFG